MDTTQKQEQKVVKQTRFARFFRRLIGNIKELFQPEEVEVTFRVEGKRINYTYTKVEHKQVA